MLQWTLSINVPCELRAEFPFSVGAKCAVRRVWLDVRLRLLV
jgi:hypothetical protein